MSGIADKAAPLAVRTIYHRQTDVVMFKLFFSLSFVLIFVLSFAQISPAEACDADHVWPDEVAWATHVISDIEYCEGDNTYYCAHMIRSCLGKAREILAEIERKKQEKIANESESEKKLKKEKAEATEKYFAEMEKEWEVREEAEALKELREEHPEHVERLTEALKELREKYPEYADKEYFQE